MNRTLRAVLALLTSVAALLGLTTAFAGTAGAAHLSTTPCRAVADPRGGTAPLSPGPQSPPPGGVPASEQE
ncbi:hypothetical protein AB0D40_36965 [Streptomyces massasporeus]|uniref:hypothetical protein n=1 Tax=Streptomyces massasporeus TaxID=67324 RepID=UPI0033D541F3